VVAFSHAPLATLLEMNDYTHKNGIAFIATATHGLFGSLFCDFGPSFMVVDQNGEAPATGMVSSISPEGLVFTMEEGRHGLEDGDVVTFDEVEGLDVNHKEFKVEVKSPDTFTIGDIENLGTYIKGGIFTQVKVPKEYHFVPPHSFCSNIEMPSRLPRRTRIRHLRLREIRPTRPTPPGLSSPGPLPHNPPPVPPSPKQIRRS
jgi:molybdopterin/thiamine biosynthesis adenylyltransferase